MNDHELEARLRNISVPERPDAYWNDFPARVRVQLRREPIAFARRNVWRVRWEWARGMAFALGLIWFGERYHPIQTASEAVTQHAQAVRQEVARLEAGLRLVMFNPQGFGYLLSEPT